MDRIKIKVKPNSKKTEILSQNSEEIILAVKSPPENNKANIELIKFLSKYFNQKIKILHGLKSKNKLIGKA